MNPLYPDVARRAGHRCEYCHAPEGAFNFPFEVEHIAPAASGGQTEQGGQTPAQLAAWRSRPVADIGGPSFDFPEKQFMILTRSLRTAKR